MKQRRVVCRSPADRPARVALKIHLAEMLLFSLAAGPGLWSGCSPHGSPVVFIEKAQEIEIYFGDRFFTAYRMDPEYTKPVLYPLFSPSGYRMTRAYPFVEIEGESTDHPHHAGLFFTYDRVNGEGFWNNTSIPPQVKHDRVLEQSGGKKGQLAVRSYWMGRSGQTLLDENRRMIFSREKDGFIIDFRISLAARDSAVTFEDTKEGMFAIRVASWLQEEKGTGSYLSSNGARGEKEVWGRRAEWMRLEGCYQGEPAGIIIFNHPESVNFPTFWHARGYGLFSANPLGQFAFESQLGLESPKSYSLHLSPGDSAVFRFRVVVYEGEMPARRIRSLFQKYASS